MQIPFVPFPVVLGVSCLHLVLLFVPIIKALKKRGSYSISYFLKLLLIVPLWFFATALLFIYFQSGIASFFGLQVNTREITVENDQTHNIDVSVKSRISDNATWTNSYPNEPDDFMPNFRVPAKSVKTIIYPVSDLIKESLLIELSYPNAVKIKYFNNVMNLKVYASEFQERLHSPVKTGFGFEYAVVIFTFAILVLNWIFILKNNYIKRRRIVVISGFLFSICTVFIIYRFVWTIITT